MDIVRISNDEVFWSMLNAPSNIYNKVANSRNIPHMLKRCYRYIRVIIRCGNHDVDATIAYPDRRVAQIVTH